MMHYPHLEKWDILDPEFNVKTYTKNVHIIGPNATKFQVKIADLGFAKRVEEGDLTSTQLGTPLMMAPEVLSGY